MNCLGLQDRARILGSLNEGSGTRVASRMYDVSINTVSKLVVDLRLPSAERRARLTDYGSGCLRFPYVGDVTAGDCAKLLRKQSGYSKSFTGEGNELHLVSSAALVYVHDSADITSFEAGVRQILRKDHAIMFPHLHVPKDRP